MSENKKPLIETTSKKIEEALKHQGTVKGHGRNRFMTWSDIEEHNSLYNISISLRNGRITIAKLPDSEDYVRYGRAISYYGEYDPASENFRIEFTERILSDEKDGEYIENKYFLSRDNNNLVKKFNNILITEYLNDGGKTISYTDYDLETKQEKESFSFNLDSDNCLINGKYTNKKGKTEYAFSYFANNVSNANILVNGENVENVEPVYRKLDHYADYFKYHLDTGSIYTDFFTGDFLTEIAKTVKQNEDVEAIYDLYDPSFRTKILSEFDEVLRRRLKTFGQAVPLCELYQRIRDSLTFKKQKTHKKD